MSSFKVCPKCQYEWKTRDDFLKDPFISLIGLMADDDDYQMGAYLFDHRLPGNRCSTTLALYVNNFLDLYDGPDYKDLKAGSEECSGFCAKVDALERCNNKCRNAIAREIMHKVINILSKKQPKQNR
jgi:hypothetical protein